MDQKKLNKTVQEIAEKGLISNSKRALQDISHKIFEQGFCTLKYALKHYISLLPKEAMKLEKNCPTVNWGETPIWLPKSKIYLLRDVFGHLLNNSLAHGIEKPAARKLKGLCETGQIFLSVKYEIDCTKIRFRDDGNGLNLDKLGEITSSENGDQKLADTIFESGVSTAKSITDISGRGVGMNAVKSFLIKEGGNIHIEFLDDASLNGYRKFEFVITLPYVIPASLQQSKDEVELPMVSERILSQDH